MLRIIGRTCENTENKRIVPKFNLAGVFGYNCAKFCTKVLDEFGFFSYHPKEYKPDTTRKVLSGLNFASGILTFAVGLTCAPVGAFAFGCLTGANWGVGSVLAQQEIDKFKTSVVIPNDILYEILELYKRYQRDYRRPIPLSNFFVFAHDQEEREASRTRETARERVEQMDYYNRFTLKSISDIIRRDVSVDKKCTEVFYTTLF